MGYHIDRSGYVDVYTDGACSSNGYSGAKAGYGVFFADNSCLNVSAPVKGRATNNNAEIQAVTEAARIAHEADFKRLRIYTDSDFVIKCYNQYIPNWKRNGWRIRSGGRVRNIEELKEMDAALSGLHLEWVHVPGHQGFHGNEMADKLARQGAEQYRGY